MYIKTFSVLALLVCVRIECGEADPTPRSVAAMRQMLEEKKLPMPGSPMLPPRPVTPSVTVSPPPKEDGGFSPAIARLVSDGKGSLRVAKGRAKAALKQVFQLQDQLGEGQESVVPAVGELVQAARVNSLDDVNRILRQGAVQPDELQQALFAAAQANNDDSHFVLYFSLIGASADVTSRDSSGNSALALAMVNNCPDTATLLRQYGATE